MSKDLTLISKEKETFVVDRKLLGYAEGLEAYDHE
jgi:hypothetical protein